MKPRELLVGRASEGLRCYRAKARKGGLKTSLYLADILGGFRRVGYNSSSIFCFLYIVERRLVTDPQVCSSWQNTGTVTVLHVTYCSTRVIAANSANELDPSSTAQSSSESTSFQPLANLEVCRGCISFTGLRTQHNHDER